MEEQGVVAATTPSVLRIPIASVAVSISNIAGCVALTSVRLDLNLAHAAYFIGYEVISVVVTAATWVLVVPFAAVTVLVDSVSVSAAFGIVIGGTAFRRALVGFSFFNLIRGLGGFISRRIFCRWTFGRSISRRVGRGLLGSRFALILCNFHDLMCRLMRVDPGSLGAGEEECNVRQLHVVYFLKL